MVDMELLKCCFLIHVATNIYVVIMTIGIGLSILKITLTCALV